jgi:hypothetical protein
MLGSVTRIVWPAVDLDQVDGHVAHVGDFLHHAAHAVVAHVGRAAARWMVIFSGRMATQTTAPGAR